PTSLDSARAPTPPAGRAAADGAAPPGPERAMGVGSALSTRRPAVCAAGIPPVAMSPTRGPLAVFATRRPRPSLCGRAAWLRPFGSSAVRQLGRAAIRQVRRRRRSFRRPRPVTYGHHPMASTTLPWPDERDRLPVEGAAERRREQWVTQRIGPIKRLARSARALRIGMNLWPPFLFTG